MSEIATGGRLGAFQVKDLLGEGGMGKVWRAHDTTLGRNVALKVLPDLFADDPERLARFQREAQLLAALNHPNIAGIHGIEDDASAGIRALVLELVEGPTLADRIAHGAMPIEDALPIARQIAQAIDAAHEQGIIHRDRRLASQRPSSPASVSGGRCVPPRHGYRGSSSRHRTRHSPPPRRPLIWRLSRRHSRRLHLWRATAALRAGGRRARSEGADRHACRTGTVFLTWWRVGRLLRRHRRLVEEDLDRRRAGRDRVSKRIDLLNLETGQQTALIPIGSHPRYTPTGHIVYGTDGTLRAVPFDLDSLAVIGDPVPVLDGVVTKDIDGAANFGLAGDGSLVYATGAGSSLATNTIVWVARDGTEEDLEAGPGAYSSVRVSPDGRQLALAFDGDVHTYDTERGTFNRITTHSGTDQHPLWTVDGAHLVFESDRGGSPELFRTLADGSGTPALVLALKGSPTLVAPETWTPDGATLLFVEARLPMVDISALSMEGDRVVELLIDDEFQEGGPAIAPDGRWLAYHSNRSGQYEVYVERFPELGNRQPISIGGGRVPRWSPDGTELFYQSLDGRQLLAVPITTGPTLTAGASDVLFEGPFLASTGASRPYDPHPDGERFAMIEGPRRHRRGWTLAGRPGAELAGRAEGARPDPMTPPTARDILLGSIDEAYDRRSWHGTTLRGSLRGMGAATAAWRPADGRHNTWEIAVHCAYWKYVIRRRLAGLPRGTFALRGSDWFPTPEPATDRAWRAVLALLRDEHRQLRDLIAQVPAAALARQASKDGFSTASLVRGIAAHDLYHAGQIQLLKKLRAGA